MKKITATMIAFVFALTLVAQDKNVEKEFSNIKTIRLTTASGDITLKKSSNNDVRVSVKYSYDDDEFTPVFEEKDGRLIIKEEFSRGSHSGSSSWTLEVPDNLNLSVNSGSGDFLMEGVNSEVKCNLGSGDITIASVKAELDFNTGSGNIDLSQVEGEVSVNTGSGDIKARQGSGDFSFNAGSGNIKLDDLRGDFSVNTGSGDIRANVTLAGSSKFNSGSGNTTVKLNGDLNNDISVNSGSGDATLNFNGNPINGEVVMTANKRGGNIVAPFKFDKEETLEDGNSSTRIQKTARLGNKDIRIKVGTGSGTAEIQSK
jgi:DUF4097 and DUF4098 domain-containing protein YvlB